MVAQPSRETTVALAALIFIITLSSLQIWSEKLRESPKLIVLGGFLSSLLFFFAVVAVGNVKKEIKWLDAIGCLVLACVCAGSVHRICVTTCILFSGVVVLYLNVMSARIQTKVQEINTGKKVLSKSN